MTSTPRTVDEMRYPIGRFSRPAALSPSERETAIGTLERLPAELRATVGELGDRELDTTYREGGWTLRQVVHHLADSHLNAYARIRLALTEPWPAIKPYDEAAWAELSDARTLPVEPSLALLEGIHARWVHLLRSLPEPEWQRGYQHLQNGRQTLEEVLAVYAWHSRHHLAQVTGALQHRS